MKQKNNPLSATVTIAAISIFVIGGIVLMGKTKDANSQPGGEPATGVSPANITDLVGKPVPQFSLRDRDGVEYSSENLKGKNVVLFFNEGLMCYPACWNQIVALAQDKRFQNDTTVVLSVVTDAPGDWRQAIVKMPELGYAKTLFDPDRKASKVFGVLTTGSSMHYGSLPGHTYIVIDKNGVIRYVYDDPRMAINNNLIFAELGKLSS